MQPFNSQDKFIVSVSFNAAGCLPDSEEYPLFFESMADALEYVREELKTTWDYVGTEEAEEAYNYAIATLESVDPFYPTATIPCAPESTYAWHIETTEINLTEIQSAALNTLLWVSPVETEDGSDYNGYFLDSELEVDADSLAFFNGYVSDFVTTNGALILQTLEHLDSGNIGHDFTLTSGGHGVGFWDRGLGALGNELTEACRGYSFDVFTTDNNTIGIG